MSKVIIVHDALTQYGGAERVLDQLKILFPEAPIAVAVHDPKYMPGSYADYDIRSSYLNKIPFARKRHRLLLPLYPAAMESFDLGAYELVISSAYAFAHGVLTHPRTLHINYCHSPARFLWDYHRYVDGEQIGLLKRALISPHLARLRQWDRLAAERPSSWIATSRLVRDRIQKFYGKPSVIIPPPVDTSRFDSGHGRGDYYLMLMRLVGWKRPDIVVRACTKLGLKLVVAGDGRELEALKRIAGPTIEFTGRVNDAQMRPLYANCKAFILPAEEDFGITPLEAMSSGRPVIAYGRGGALDTVLPGVTGEFFHEQTTECLMQTLIKFDPDNYDPATIKNHVSAFDNQAFRQRMSAHISSLLEAHRASSLA